MLSRVLLTKIGSLFDVCSMAGGLPEAALARLAQCAGSVTLASACAHRGRDRVASPGCCCEAANSKSAC